MLRFASSPTKDLDIGNLRVALFNFIVSKQLNEDLLIRIDDINKKKNIEGKEKEIIELLSLFSIDHKSVVYQSENLKYHQKMAMQLMAQKKAFACFCSDDKLNELKQEAKNNKKVFEYDGFCATLSDETVLNCNAPFTVRIQKPNEAIAFEDTLKGNLQSTTAQVDAFFILDHDKAPTANYACAVDDMLYNISTLLRSDENLLNTPKELHVRSLLGYDKQINYIHVPTLLNEDISVQSLIEKGFLPSAIANYLVLLGNTTPTEIFSMEEAIEWFDIKNIASQQAKFDIKKLKYINKKHLEMMDDMRLSKILGFADTDIGKLAKLFLQECSTIEELKTSLQMIFSCNKTDEKLEAQLKILRDTMSSAPYFEHLNDLKAHIMQHSNLKENALNKVLHYIITGRHDGPSVTVMYPFIKNYLGEIIK